MLKTYSDSVVCLCAALPASYAAVSAGCFVARIISTPTWSLESMFGILVSSVVLIAPMTVFAVPVVLLVGLIVGFCLGVLESDSPRSADCLVFSAGGLASGIVFALVTFWLKKKAPAAYVQNE